MLECQVANASNPNVAAGVVNARPHTIERNEPWHARKQTLPPPVDEHPAETGTPALEAPSPGASSGQSRREFLKRVAAAGAGLAAAPILLLSDPSAADATSPPLAPAPGAPLPWHAGAPIYKGVMNQSTGNAQLSHRITGWGGTGGGLSFALFFNSQSSRTSVLGPKWTHSYNSSNVKCGQVASASSARAC
jgi:hypothetical protein